MTIRTMACAAGALIAVAGAALPAQAQFYDPRGPSWQPGLPPPPGGGYGPPPYGRGYGPPPGYGYGQPPGYGPISCAEGARIVASQGFRDISVRECSGRVFRYTAFRRGQPFEVRVSSRTGDITLVRAI